MLRRWKSLGLFMVVAAMSHFDAGRSEDGGGVEIPELSPVHTNGESLSRDKRQSDNQNPHQSHSDDSKKINNGRHPSRSADEKISAEENRIYEYEKKMQEYEEMVRQRGDNVNYLQEFATQANTSTFDIFSGGDVTSQYFSHLMDLINEEQHKRQVRIAKSSHEIPPDAPDKEISSSLFPPPKNFTVARKSWTRIFLEWKDPEKTPSQYFLRLVRIPDADERVLVANPNDQKQVSVPGTQNEYIFESLRPAMEYKINIFAVYGDDAKSASVNLAVFTSIPAPTSLSVSRITTNGFKANWVPAPRGSGVTGIQLRIEELGGSYAYTVQLRPKVSYYKVTGLQPGTRYRVTLRSDKRGSLSSGLSSEVTTGNDFDASTNTQGGQGPTTKIELLAGNADLKYIRQCSEQRRTDLVILIDGSWSVGPQNFQKMKDFLASLADAFRIGYDAALIGVAQYSDDPRVEFSLSEHVRKGELIQAIRDIQYKGGNTATGRALNFLREEMFAPGQGRSDDDEIRKTAVIITDGESILDDVTGPAERLRQHGVEVFSIGVGAALESELQDIATDPDGDHVFSVRNFDDIQEIKDKLLQDVCKNIPVCPTPESPTNGRVDCDSSQLLPGNVCSFTCNSPSFELNDSNEASLGQATRTCGENGHWDRPFPECIPAVCSDLEPPSYGSYDCVDRFRIGSSCALRCDEGYKVSGDAETLCRRDSRWSNPRASCIRITCPVLSAIPDGDVDCEDRNFYGSQCTYACNEGYNMNGSPITNCLSSGSWSRPPPTCTLITCSPLSSLANGQTKCSDSSNYDTTCTFTCGEGYELMGSSQAVCDSQGWWQFSQSGKMPRCERITCNPVTLAPHVSKSCMRGNDFGSLCTFECEEGYILSGPTSATCGGSTSPGEWSHNSPTCEIATCSRLEAPAHGRVTCTDMRNYASRCTLACDEGYELIGKSSVECAATRLWKGELSSCRRITCGEIEAVTHGSVECSDFDNYNSRCEYTCHVGYKMTAGARVRVCGSDRFYTGESPTCSIKSCENLPAPDHGRIKCSHSNNYGSSCRYFCDLGYELAGDMLDELDGAERSCQDDEQWSGTAPSCQMITCGTLQPPVNGDGFCSDGGNFGSICQFSCDTGFEVTGSEERMCRESKKWTGEATNCKLITCEALQAPENGRITCSARDSLDGEELASLSGFGTKCNFACNEGYYLTGTAKRVCGKDKTWKGVDASCVRIRCPVLPEPLHASMTCSASNEYGSECTVTCDVGHYLTKGSARRRCKKNSSWSGKEPVCNVKTCDDLVAKPHTTLTCTNGNRFGSICTIKAELGYRLHGPSVIECKDNGSVPTPPATLITCETLKASENGLMTCTKESDYDSVCSFICLEGHDIIGSASRTCMLNGEWSDEQATCLLATCPRLENPQNGEIECSAANSYQSTCSYSCDEGYELSESVVRTCKANHAWTGNSASCIRITCDELDPPRNGKINCSDGNDFSSSCTFVCDEGYEMRGSPNRACRGDHAWSGTPTSCHMITCPELPVPRNGRKKCTDSSNFGSECTFVCEVGHTFAGSKSRTCVEGHTWTGNGASCTIVTCGRLETPVNGSKRCEDEDNYESKCRFSCELGFDMIGSASRTCEADGNWSGKPTSCEIAKCGVARSPDNAIVSCTDEDRYESVCKYKCDDGYDIIGSTTRVCQSDHTWTGTKPFCRVGRCGPLKDPLNGAVDCSDGDKYLSQCAYSCDIGYKLTISSGRRSCTADHVWSGTQPYCELVTCPPLNVPEKATLDCSRGLSYMSECRFIPKAGYALSGQRLFRCGKDGTWDYPPGELIANVLSCDELQAPNNGNMICTRRFEYESVCRFICDIGYELQGSSSRTCQDTQKWTGGATSCEKIECPPIQAPQNGEMRCTEEFAYDSTCEFRCEEGHELLGSDSTSCQRTRAWTKERPLCVLIACGSLPITLNGHITCTAGDRYNSVCTMECAEGYRRLGSQSRTCLESRTWSGDEPSCVLIRCGPRDAPAHGSLSCSAGDAYSSTCTFSCNMGYRLIGGDISTCSRSGRWVGETPSCKMITCEELTSPENGDLRCTSGNQYNSLCRTICMTGYDLIGSRQRVCQGDGTFSGEPASCRLVKCEELEDLDSGTIICNDEQNFGSECTYVCDEGFHLVGAVSRTCLSSGHWSNTNPHCERVRCRTLRSPSHGAVSCTNGNIASSVCRVTCDSCYNLLGSQERICRDDGSWTGEEPACSVLSCSPLMAPFNGVKECGERAHECGNTCGFACNKGYKLLGSSSRTCQDTGVWTGTLAECLRDECPALISLDEEVSVSCTDGNRIGSNCSFSCKDNSSNLVGSTHRVCQKGGIWSNSDPVCRACKTSVSDIMFIIDGSWSVGDSGFRKVKDFLKALVLPFQVGWDNTRFAIVQYSDDPRTEFLLTDYLTLNEVLSAIDAMPYKGGNTNTGRAVTFALYNALSLASGARPFVRKTAVVLTDGRSQDDVGNPAREMRNAGIKVVAVGVGDADIHELKLMASPPHDSTVYHVQDYDSIKQIQTLLAARLCEDDIPRPAGLCNCPAGPPGPPGSPGLPGPPGDATAAVKGAKGDPFSVIHVNYADQVIEARDADGSIVELNLPDGLQTIKSNDGSKVFFPMRGHPGPPGDPGAKGPRGPSGASGPPGPAGQPGPRGPPGDVGPDGQRGQPGEKGDRGEASDAEGLSPEDRTEILLTAKQQTLQVVQAEMRRSLIDLDRERRIATRAALRGSGTTTVIEGPRGPPGPPGPQGYEGPTGPQGIPGATGLTGPKGEKGETGDIGPRGPSGIGVPGPEGAPGPRGPRGKPGKSVRGKTGPRGPRGKPGKNGKSRKKGDVSPAPDINRL